MQALPPDANSASFLSPLGECRSSRDQSFTHASSRLDSPLLRLVTAGVESIFSGRRQFLTGCGIWINVTVWQAIIQDLAVTAKTQIQVREPQIPVR